MIRRLTGRRARRPYLRPALDEAAAQLLERVTGRTPRVELLDGDTGERRALRIRLDGPVLRVRRQRLITFGPRAGELLPGWRWAVWNGCALFAHGEADSWAAAHARGGAALDQAVARAQAAADVLEQVAGG